MHFKGNISKFGAKWSGKEDVRFFNRKLAISRKR